MLYFGNFKVVDEVDISLVDIVEYGFLFNLI